MTEIRNSQIENIKISEGVYVVSEEKFYEVFNARRESVSILRYGVVEREELLRKAKDGKERGTIIKGG